jgi:uncharacterized protein (TIGR03086 family)
MHRGFPVGDDAAGPTEGAAEGGNAMDAIDQLDEIIPALDELAGRVTPDQFDNATPCASFRVRDLFDHLIDGATQFAPQLRGEAAGAPAVAAARRDEDRPPMVKAALTELLSATKAPGALGRSIDLPFGTVPGSVLVRFLTVDGMVHASDLARATGQRYEPPEALAQQVLATAHELIAPEMRDGETFAAAVPVADDAPPLTRLVAFTGRAV